ncbi:ATP-binding protein [Streptomyces sp. NPDC005890]|uniref:ATP-binding protein n=1 Tax=Streptomyces sp. NPDC005890 TaxID=3154568 RepID=UPI0033E46879
MNEQSPHPRTRQAFYRRDRRSVRLAREFARETLTDWATDGRGDDVLLCVSELATNALVHGVPAGRGFLLRLTLHDDGVVRVEVHDSGPGEVRTPETSPDAEHGRGLLLVAALADKWGVGERNPGKFVWCEFHRAPSAHVHRAGCTGRTGRPAVRRPVR